MIEMQTRPRPTKSKIYILVESQNDACTFKFEMHHELCEDSMVPIIIFPFPLPYFCFSWNFCQEVFFTSQITEIILIL